MYVCIQQARFSISDAHFYAQRHTHAHTHTHSHIPQAHTMQCSTSGGGLGRGKIATYSFGLDPAVSLIIISKAASLQCLHTLLTLSILFRPSCVFSSRSKRYSSVPSGRSSQSTPSPDPILPSPSDDFAAAAAAARARLDTGRNSIHHHHRLSHRCYTILLLLLLLLLPLFVFTLFTHQQRPPQWKQSIYAVMK